jgi:mannobiose 2-epimerase
MLEFQARQTRTAARLGTAYPDEPAWPEIASHGFRYLNEVMRDHAEGGWFWMVDRTGKPLADATKHAHGTAYVMDACLDVYRLTGAPEALQGARDAFEWLEGNVHDSVDGGYFGWVARNGTPIMQALPSAAKGTLARDPLGHGIGMKDANVHSDLLEALTVLFEAWPDPRVEERLREVYELLTDRFITPAGSMHYLLYPDLTPVPGVERYGYPLQTASRLPPAALALGLPLDDAIARARRIVDHAMATAWDELRGGTIEAGPAAEPFVLSGVSLRVTTRPWWVQTEALKAHLLLGLQEPVPGRYLEQFERNLELIDREYLDQRFGGWYTVARSDRSRLDGLLRRGVRKGDIWKDASHETEFYLTAMRMLRGLGPNTAIGLA